MRIFVLVLFLLSMAPVRAAGLINICSDPSVGGKSCFPVYAGAMLYRIDRGGFGDLSSSDLVDLIQDVFGRWNAVPSSKMRLVNDSTSPRLSQDYDRAQDFVGLAGRDSALGYSPLFFDNNSSIIKGLGIDESLVLGLAGPRLVDPVNSEIIESFALFNDYFLKESTMGEDLDILVATFKATLLHEVGHMIGLDHTQVHLDAFLPTASSIPNQPSDIVSKVPVMFPIAVDDTSELLADDIAAISSAYPNANFRSNFGTIKGRLVDAAGQLLTGVNVVAFNIDDPFDRVYSSVAGKYGAKGQFVIEGVRPGNYVLRIRKIYGEFSGSSSVGPYEPYEGDLQEGFYNGENRALKIDYDSLTTNAIVSLSAGETVTGINIVASYEQRSGDILDDASDDDGNVVTTSVSREIDFATASDIRISDNFAFAGDLNVYEITVPERARVTLRSSGDLDTYAELSNSQTLIVEDDDSGVETNFLISKILGAGTYELIVNEFTGTKTGTYDLIAKFEALSSSATFHFREASTSEDGELAIDVLAGPKNKVFKFKMFKEFEGVPLSMELSTDAAYASLVKFPNKGLIKVAKGRTKFKIALKIKKAKQFEALLVGKDVLEIPIYLKDQKTGFTRILILNLGV